MILGSMSVVAFIQGRSVNPYSSYRVVKMQWSYRIDFKVVSPFKKSEEAPTVLLMLEEEVFKYRHHFSLQQHSDL